ncbi:MAG: hypothetical protein K6B75_07075, partial [Lachnospiraceae bacterium]|nr:hypothetical protein [Lachnospiraceae bacterium]
MVTSQEILKRITSGYKIPDAFERWADYRERITDYIIKYTEPGKKIAVFGAGECNDLNLVKLSGHAGELVLVDRFPEDTVTGLQKQGLGSAGNIVIKEQNFLGFKEEDYLRVIDIVLEDMKNLGPMWVPQISAGRLSVYLEEKFNEINKKEDYFGEESFDYTLAIGLHSQLIAFIQNIWEAILRNEGYTDRDLFKKTSEENDVLMPR